MAVEIQLPVEWNRSSSCSYCYEYDGVIRIAERPEDQWTPVVEFYVCVKCMKKAFDRILGRPNESPLDEAVRAAKYDLST